MATRSESRAKWNTHLASCELQAVGNIESLTAMSTFKCLRCEKTHEGTMSYKLKRDTHSCPHCNIKKPDQSKNSHKTAVRYGVVFAAASVALVDEYESSTTTHKFHCGVCHHEWVTTPLAVSRTIERTEGDNSGCPNCATSSARDKRKCERTSYRTNLNETNQWEARKWIREMLGELTDDDNLRSTKIDTQMGQISVDCVLRGRHAVTVVLVAPSLDGIQRSHTLAYRKAALESVGYTCHDFSMVDIMTEHEVDPETNKVWSYTAFDEVEARVKAIAELSNNTK